MLVDRLATISLAISLVIIILNPIMYDVYAQTRNNERLVIPFNAANSSKSNPAQYEFKQEHIANWIINISNYLIYNPNNENANVIIRLINNYNTKEFLELGMASKDNMLWFAVSKEQTGYTTMYKNINAWFQDKQIMLTYAQGDRLSVNNGQRIIVDRLNIGQFAIKSIEVFSSIDDPSMSSSVGGQLIIDIVSGNPLDNPIMSIPFIVTGAVAGIVLILLKTRRRD